VMHARSNSPQLPWKGRATATWIVQPFYDAQLVTTRAKGWKRRQRGWRRGSYTFDLRNTGNVPTRYALSAAGNDAELTLTPETDALTLKPGATATVGLALKAPLHWIGATRTQSFSVEATATDAAGKALFQDVTRKAESRFTHRPIVPRALLALIPLLLFPAILLYLLLNKQPSLATDPSTNMVFNQPVQKVGTASTPLPVKLTNTGQRDLTINTIAVTGTNAASFLPDASQCTVVKNTIPPGGECTVNVTFLPDTPGSITATLVVSDNAPTHQQTVGLHGTAAVPVAQIAPVATFPFGSLAARSDATRVVTVTNASPVDLVIQSITLSPTPSGAPLPFAIAGSSCPTFSPPLSPHSSCRITIRFHPRTRGIQRAQLLIVDDAPRVTRPIALNGRGIAPVARVDRVAVSFGPRLVGAPAEQTIILTNLGDAALRVGHTTRIDTAAVGIVASPCTITDGRTGARRIAICVRLTPKVRGPFHVAVPNRNKRAQPCRPVGRERDGYRSHRLAQCERASFPAAIDRNQPGADDRADR